MLTVKRRVTQQIKDIIKSQIYTPNHNRKRTKVVGTIGPVSNNDETIKSLVNSGLNVFRLNMSHGTLQSQEETVNIIRRTYSSLYQTSGMPILMDLKGPSIRTGKLKNGESVKLVKDQTLIITTDSSFIGSKDKIACSYADLISSVKVGSKIYVGDGNLALEVIKIDQENQLHTRVLNNYTLGESKNMNLPGNRVNLPTITEKDTFVLKNFTIPLEIDMVSVSFCRSADDIQNCRNILGLNGRQIKVIAKIENHEGINNLEEIIQASDGIMIARGDLGMEIPPEKITIAQKLMTRLCRKHLKPVINATQMLESMVLNSRPTRAEIADVTNAVLDGNDCVMLSGETSAGAFPIQSVEFMRNIAEQAEDCIDYEGSFFQSEYHPKTEKEALINCAVAYSLSSNANLIIVISEDPSDAKYCALLRPHSFVLAPMTCDYILRSFEMFSGLYGVKVNPAENLNERVKRSINQALAMKLIEGGLQCPYIVIDMANMSVKKY
jgi:pyruvate kinase